MKPADQFLEATTSKVVKTPKKEVRRFRTIWISDLHLGTSGCQAKRLLEFLKATDSNSMKFEFL